MKRGGKVSQSQREQTFRLLGLILPIGLFLYGLLLTQDLLPFTRLVNTTIFFSIMIPWLAVGVIQFIYIQKSKQANTLKLVLYHILLGAFVIGVSGLGLPFIAGWVLLTTLSYLFFEERGLKLSLVMASIVTGIDMFLHLESHQLIVQDLSSLVAVFIIGIASALLQPKPTIKKVIHRTTSTEAFQRDRILTIINNLADPILSTDRNGVIQVFNAACLNLLDTNNDLNGHPIDDILNLYSSADEPVRLSRDFKKARGVVVRDDLTITVDNEVVRLEVTFSPIRSSYTDANAINTPDGYVVILRDITKAKSLEEERDEFISVVSHELRTPITIAEGTISNLQLMMSRGDIPKTTLSSNVDMAHEQVLFLAKMVNDLSTLSRAERGVADTAEDIDIQTLAHDLYNEYAPQAEAKQLHLNLNLGTAQGKVLASPLYLKELLQNFITNAIKYTKEGHIDLTITTQDGYVSFEVQDTGIGISKADQAKIFQKFYRSEDYRTRETGGTGLGLYVATKLAKKLGTHIEFSSRLNHGSRFQITLPLHLTPSSK